MTLIKKQTANFFQPWKQDFLLKDFSGNGTIIVCLLKKLLLVSETIVL